MKAYINGISYYLPKSILDNVQLSNQFPEWSIDKISEKTGIYKRHISEDNEYSSDMGINVIEQFLIEYNVNKEEIDFLLFCTQSPDYLLPTTACLIQDKVGFKKTCGALDFNLGCSGYIYGLGLAKGLVETDQARNVLLVTSETYSKFIHKRDKSNRTIFGDAATATLITSEPKRNHYKFSIGNFAYGTDGSGYDKLIIKNSGVKHKCITSSDLLDEEGNFISNDDYIFMDGKEIFNFTAFEVPPLIERLLKVNGITLDDVSMHIFHQANEYMLNFIRKRCKIPEVRFFISLNDIGNTVSSTIPIALRRYLDNLKLEINHKILLAGFGVGLSLGGVIINLE